MLQHAFPQAEPNVLRSVVSFGETLRAQKGAPELSHDASEYVAAALHVVRGASGAALVRRAYPYALMVLEPPVVAAIEAGLLWLRLGAPVAPEPLLISGM